MLARSQKSRRTIIECPVCKKWVVGAIPKGGDGSALKPWRHISALDGHTNPCPGSFMLVDIPKPEILTFNFTRNYRGN